MANAAIAKSYIENFINPPLKKAMAETLDDKSLLGRFDLIPMVNSLDWTLTIRRLVEWTAVGERPMISSDEIVGGKITFQVVFLPEVYKPPDAKIQVEWGEFSINFDEDWWESIWAKYWCHRCSAVKGVSCKCSSVKMKTVAIGKLGEMMEHIARDVLSAMVNLKVPKTKAEAAIDKAKAETAYTSFEPFFKRAMAIYGEAIGAKVLGMRGGGNG